MGRRLIFATLSLGVMMACTLVTAQAADYRKDKVKYSDKYEVLTSDVALTTYQVHNYFDFVVAETQFVFTPKVTYLFPANEPKPKNRQVNGLINDRREQERISIGLNL